MREHGKGKMTDPNNGRFSPPVPAVMHLLCLMKKIKINLFTGEYEADGQSNVYQVVTIFIMAAFLLSLAFFLKDGILLTLLKKVHLGQLINRFFRR
jgi:hypothetical protein